ncbi:MAG: hypothetical protein KBE02_04050 [Sulfurospirillum sp.]|nr:hypothetical protein [Sulfurospirillum sp.]
MNYYDNYQPFNEFKDLDFSFFPRQYEIWENGRHEGPFEIDLILQSLNCNAKNNRFEFNLVLNLHFKEEFVRTTMASDFSFDYGVTSTDRLLLISLPQRS